MDDDTEKKARAHNVLKSMERTHTDALKARVNANQRRVDRIKPLLLAGVGAFVGGWTAHILARGFHWPLTQSISMGAMGLGVVVYVRQLHVAREAKIESALIRKTRIYPGFRERYNRMVAWLSALAAGVFIVTLIGSVFGDRIYPGFARSPNFSKYVAWAMGFTMTFWIVALIVGFLRLRNVRCPQCGSKLLVKKYRSESRDDYSGVCRPCGILWNLDVSNSSD
jgi:hypothetical protein